MIEPIELQAAKREASAAVGVGNGKMREWNLLDAADSGGGMAESGQREGRDEEPCGRRAWGLRRQRKSLRRQKKVLRRQRKLLGRKNGENRDGFFYAVSLCS